MSTGVSVSAQAAITFLPVAVEPVNATLSTPARHSAAPVSPKPVTTWKHRPVRPTSAKVRGQPLADAGGVLAGLEHHGVAGGQRVGDRAHRREDRVVPRADHADDAERLVLHGRRLVGHQQPGRDPAPPEHLLGVPGRPGQVVDGEGGLEQRVAVRLAGLAGASTSASWAIRRVITPFQAPSALGALVERQGRPPGGGLAGAGDGGAHVVLGVHRMGAATSRWPGRASRRSPARLERWPGCGSRRGSRSEPTRCVTPPFVNAGNARGSRDTTKGRLPVPTPIDPTSAGFLFAENRSHADARRRARSCSRSPRARDATTSADLYEEMRDVDEIAPLFLKHPHRSLTHGRPVGLDRGRAVRHRVPRPAQRAAQARPGPRAARAVLAAAQHPAGPGAAAVGGAPDRGPARRPGRDVHQDPPRARRRRLRDAAAAERAVAPTPTSATCRRRGRRRSRPRPPAAQRGGRARPRPTCRSTRCARRSASAPRPPACPARWSGRSPRACATRPRRCRSTRRARSSTSTITGLAPVRRPGLADRAAARRSARPPAPPSTTWCWRCAAARCAPTSLELDALPDTTLVAMVPVGLNAKQSPAAPRPTGGNAVGAVMVKLGTDLADPADRLQPIHALDARRQGGAGRDDAGADPGDERARPWRPRSSTPMLRMHGHHAAAVQPDHQQRAGPAEARTTSTAPGWTASTRCRSRSTGMALNITCTSYDRQHGLRPHRLPPHACRTCSGC